MAPSHGLLPEPCRGCACVCRVTQPCSVLALHLLAALSVGTPRTRLEPSQHLDYNRLWVCHEMSCFVARVPAPLMCQTSEHMFPWKFLS